MVAQALAHCVVRGRLRYHFGSTVARSKRLMAVGECCSHSIHRGFASIGSSKTRYATRGTYRRLKSTSQSVGQSPSYESYQILQAFRSSLQSALLRPRTVPVPRWITPKHYEVTLSEIFGHSSFVLVAISYAVDDFLHLRILAVAGSSAMLFFTYFHPHGRVLWLPFKWNALFIAINSYRIGRVLMDEWRAQSLPEDMLRVRNDHFYAIDLKDFAKLDRLGTRENYRDGEVVVRQGDNNQYIRLVLDGTLKAERDGVHTYNLEEGNFVSECGLHAGLLLQGKVESCCEIVARGEVKLIRWDRTELMDVLNHSKDLRRSLKIALSWDIVRKLKGQRSLLATGEVNNPEYWTQKRQEQTDARYDAILNNMLHHREYMNKWKDQLNKYRMMHQIDDEHHRIALKRFGWTPKEFAIGHRANEEKEEVEDRRRGWKGWARDIMMRFLE